MRNLGAYASFAFAVLWLIRAYLYSDEHIVAPICAMIFCASGLVCSTVLQCTKKEK